MFMNLEKMTPDKYTAFIVLDFYLFIFYTILF